MFTNMAFLELEWSIILPIMIAEHAEPIPKNIKASKHSYRI